MITMPAVPTVPARSIVVAGSTVGVMLFVSLVAAVGHVT